MTTYDFYKSFLHDWQTTQWFVYVFVVSMLLDSIGGYAAAFARKTLSSTIAREGAVRKVLMFLIVVFSALIDSFIPNVTIAGIGEVPWAAGACLLFIANEGLSLLEKASVLGVPIPQGLQDALIKIRPNAVAMGENLEETKK